MENNLEKRMEKYAKKHKRKKVWKKILSVLSAVVVFCTTYALILPAITQEREVFCNTEEHIHSEECQNTENTEKILVCEIPEEESHSHSEECCTENLICTEENHSHTEDCFVDGELICEKTEGHIHDETCTEKLLICEKEEKTGHTHTEECFIIENTVCLKEEHSHSLACYSDANADIETEEQWTAAFAEKIPEENFAERMVTIAKSQLGYHESTVNYTVGEDETVKGRTRYGEWYEDPYADWNIIFAGFCIRFAEAEIPFNADIEKWTEELSLSENDFYKTAEEHKPLPGDLVFISTKDPEKADTVGIVYEVYETEIKIIAGDIGDCVQALTYEKEDPAIKGYCMIAEPLPYVCGTDEHLHEEKCFDEEGNLICEKDEHIHNEECLLNTDEEEPGETGEETEEPPEYICGFDEHIHEENCADENGNIVCEIEEHTHTEECLSAKGEETEEPTEYICGFDEHSHTEECYDGETLICEIAEHLHSEDCIDYYSTLTEEEKLRIENVIAMIEELPAYEEIEEKIIAFEDAEDYEGEEIWLTELYRKVGLAYKYYSDLPEKHREFVTNEEKLWDLEFIWSMAFLVEVEIGETVEYTSGLITNTRFFVIYTEGENGYYAINGTGAAVPINIDENGVITADVLNRDELLWSFSSGSGGYQIRNKSSGRYMYAYTNNGGGVTNSSSNRSTVVETSGGVKIKSNTAYAMLDEENKVFRVTQNEAEAAVYNFGLANVASDIYIWFDGTWGGLDSLSGSDNLASVVTKGGKLVLPTEWKTPDSYSYKVRGWYDIVEKKYYAPGTEIYPEKNTVFYPDWVPASYNIGQFNAQTSNTVSTNDFITTKVFDYSPFYNLPYVTANVTVSASGHSETWSLGNQNDFIFRDWNPGKFSSPDGGTSGVNSYTEYNENAGLLNSALIERLFGTGNSFDPITGSGVMGKTYLGTGDHFFQYCDDPSNTEYYGYYYYDSLSNAASYNQSAQRFYVYDYLVRADSGGTADFLPLNSPYVNTNGKTVATYSENGTTNYEFSGGSDVSSEYWFGIQTDINFYLSGKPGTSDSEGNRANQGINGEDLVFEFTGDDDVWVMVDGNLVLDIGGIHQAVSGSINFSTGEVIVNGSKKTSVTYLEPGDHVLTMYYLERGAGDSNCKIKFNISTRYGLKLQKEDVLTRELLNGAEFTVYSNEACTNEVYIWETHAGYEAGNSPQSTFAVKNGVAEMWGLAAGNTYYIKETKYPTNGGYGVANGIIVMKLNSKGQATFDVIPDPNANGSDLSGGFTVHGYKIDVENHEAYLVATNGKEEYGGEVTSVTVKKEWNDSKDHSNDSVTVYILANGFRIQETVLSAENNWTHTWKNLPVNGDSGKPVTYTVEEGTVPGYFGTITPLKVTTGGSSGGGTGEFKKVSSFTDGKNYIIVSNNAPLYATESGELLRNWNISIPQYFSGGKWTAKVSGSTVTLTNDLGMKIYYSNSYGNRYFSVSKNPSGGTNLSFVSNMLAYNDNGQLWYMDWSEGKTVGVSQWGGPQVVLYEEIGEPAAETTVENGFLITNTPVAEAEKVSFTVKKQWDVGNLATEKDYEQLSVTIKLLSNKTDSGISAEVNLKNGWQYTFTNLPKYDNNGKEIVYSVEEVWFSNEWRPEYGGITKTGENSFETTVTNIYNLGYELPKTGGAGTQYNIIGGIFLITAGLALIYKQIHRKRRKEDTS